MTFFLFPNLRISSCTLIYLQIESPAGYLYCGVLKVYFFPLLPLYRRNWNSDFNSTQCDELYTFIMELGIVPYLSSLLRDFLCFHVMEGNFQSVCLCFFDHMFQCLRSALSHNVHFHISVQKVPRCLTFADHIAPLVTHYSWMLYSQMWFFSLALTLLQVADASSEGPGWWYATSLQIQSRDCST